MTLVDQTFAQAMTLAGEQSERQAELLRMMCQGAVNNLTASLRDGLTPDDCRSDFVSAASLMALAALSEVGEGDTVTNFTAGDVSIRREHSSAAANCLRYQARVMMMPYIRDCFSFLGV